GRSACGRAERGGGDDRSGHDEQGCGGLEEGTSKSHGALPTTAGPAWGIRVPYLTAPAVRLRTSCFWKMRSRMTRGTNAMTAPARAMGMFWAEVPTSCLSPICTVSSGEVPPVATRGHR